jgi:hypothetical protein
MGDIQRKGLQGPLLWRGGSVVRTTKSLSFVVLECFPGKVRVVDEVEGRRKGRGIGASGWVMGKLVRVKGDGRRCGESVGKETSEAQIGQYGQTKNRQTARSLTTRGGTKRVSSYAAAMMKRSE